MAAMKMRQSLAQIEQEFREEVQQDRHRRERLRRHAAHRSRMRTVEREKKKSSARYWVLIGTLLLTAVVVTIGMFEALYWLLS